MRTLFRTLLIIFLGVIVAIVWFFLWAKQSVLPQEEYESVVYFDEHRSSPSSDSTFTVVTYNIGYLSGMTNNRAVETDETFYTNNLGQVIKTFQKVNPDIIAFQEIDFGANRSYEVNQLAALGKALGFPNGAKAVNWDKRYVPFPYFPLSAHFGRMHSGQGYLSHYPIESHARIVLERVTTNPFYYDAFYIDRLAEVVQTTLQGRKLTLINVHLEAYDKTTRRKQTDFVKALYEQYAADMPTILLGDFNSQYTESNATVQLLTSVPNLVPACPPEQLGKEAAFTYSSGKPNQQIDYIFYDSTQLDVLQWKVLQEIDEPSDHLPVMATFRFK